MEKKSFYHGGTIFSPWWNDLVLGYKDTHLKKAMS